LDFPRIFASRSRTAAYEQPIRAELFSIERLEQHAATLAAAQHVEPGRGHGRPIAPRLHDNSRVLTEAYRSIVRAARAAQPISPAAEWLLDNFHVVDEQIREIKDDLPPGFYRLLPKLADGHLKGFPRVFGIAWAVVAHSDSAFDIDKLTRFVEAYQRVQKLTIGELWAIAITLRITLVENLRRLAEGIVARLEAGALADKLAERVLSADRAQAAAVLRELDAVPWSTSFAVHLAQRLRDRDPGTTPALHWLNDKLAREGTSIDQILRDEVQRQSATNVTVRNVITSMRLISSVNWAEFFETVSPVDAVLRKDSDFAQMDFTTRDLYRRAIEEIARGSGRDESDIAARALSFAKRAAQLPRSDASAAREREPGFYLIDAGRAWLEEDLGCRVSFGTRVFRVQSRLGVMGYAGMIAVATVIVLGVSLLAISGVGASTQMLIALAFIGLIPASDIGVALVNRIITEQVSAMRLPAMELRDGVPKELAAIVVVPALLTGADDIREQIERLEVHHLSNPDASFSFALLSDWHDSATEHAEDDDALLKEAVEGIAQLNQRYPDAGNSARFFLLHRRRLWNESERAWIGWERKRGKLHELNRLLRGATDTTFVPIDGQPPLPEGIRYVITLDADTRMPIGTARRLVGKMAHPLNRPVFDAACGLVIRGHAILQPRVTPSLPIGSEGSLFQRVFSGPNGLDPYAFAVSDVYQDLFEQGSYVGKGIYDVDMFEAALRGQIPENTVLSHDLLEGILSRAGLATDIEVVEEFPSLYEVSAARQHRWTRGDWQLLPWIFGFGKSAREDVPRTKLPLMGRWKLIDNLRRSLSAPAAMLALVAGWFMPRRAAEIWTLSILLTIALPTLLPAFAGLLPPKPDVSLRSHFRALLHDFQLGLMQSGFLITFLAHQAWLMVDAVTRTLGRLVHRRRMLEWTTAAQARRASSFDPRGFAVQIAASAAFTVAVGVLLAFVRPRIWPVSSPLLALWTISPLVARLASLPPRKDGRLTLPPNEALSLRLIARRTWSFFERFVTKEDNFLPPDNFQESPSAVVARRTSPTNIGLYLLATVAARDFGWSGTLAMLERLEATLATMDRLERFRGHFYNWYATDDLRALEPKYISSVDSGNLAGHLIALGNACAEIAQGPILSPRWRIGIEDDLELLREAAHASELTDAIDKFAVQLVIVPGDPVRHLKELLAAADAMVERAKPIDGETLTRTEALRADIESHLKDAEFLGDTAASIAALAGELPAARLLLHRLKAIEESAKAAALAMEFGFLFDPDKQMLSIGYRGSDGTLDGSFYDLLASEARLASFVAIAKGDLPAKHWFRLGRAMTPIDGEAGLISWSGSMFEYLMPSLVMRAPAGSLLAQTNRLVVRRQEEYGSELSVPWGVSESAFNARNIEQTYQYSSFGVPDLGYKRGLSENVVIAPYASGLATMIDPRSASRNFERMARMGARGLYGWYEAIDFTRSRLPEGARFAIVRCYMAHHQAMTVVSIANALHDGSMRVRFHTEPIVQAAELLLQERMPRDVTLAHPAPEQVTATAEAALIPEVQRRYTNAHSRVPRTQLLSNGSYSAMLTAAGSSYSRWHDVAITRWREDTTRDPWGIYIFLRDVKSGEVWSAGYQPTGVEPESYEVVFSEDKSEIVRRDGTTTTKLEVVVSPEDDAEVRRVSITNRGLREREIEITSYAEIALARQGDDVAHPAFAKLFVETEYAANCGAILATRRQRSNGDPQVWAAHMSVVEGDSAADVQFETDRVRFLGRGQSIRAPAAIVDGWPLSNTAGPILDPIFSLRRRVRIPRGATARISFWTMAAETRDALLDLVDKHRDANAYDRAATLAWTQAQIQLRHLGLSADEAHLFQRLANHVLYSDPVLRPPPDVIRRGCRKVSTLWAHGISGDLPIVLVRIDDEADLDLVRQALRAQDYWRMKQLAVDLVILNERATSYVQNLQQSLDSMVRANQAMPRLANEEVRGAVFVLRTDLIPQETRALLLSAARAVLTGGNGTLAEQINRARDKTPGAPPPARRAPAPSIPDLAPPRPQMEFFNGLGGFVEQGREYMTVLEGDQRTPAPWINVVANPQFGFTVSTDGSGFTWARNSQQYQLTPWSNDAVVDPPGEAIYIRDEDTGELWTPTALPIREKHSAYSARHGQGYSRFEHASHGIALELTLFVPKDDAIKIARLKIVNRSGRARRLSVTSYAEWVLGQNRAVSAPFIATEINPATGAIFAYNPWNEAFGERVTFTDLGGRQMAWTGDRAEFIGRDGTLERPLALALGQPLSNRTGAGLDPCGALQAPLRLGAAGAEEYVFTIGNAASKAEAEALVQKYRKADLDQVFAEATKPWEDTLSTIQVKTPDRALDILVNRWLPYQVQACRVWARAGFYQASGAYGFRDQLQDTMALCVLRPDIAREHLLRAAGRQFPEGDVQHWWLPESGRGVRTRISDDRVWLAYAAAHYVNVTGDSGVLDEMVPYLEGRILHEGEHDAFFQPSMAQTEASLFDHCALALDKSLALGSHGLPLMGTGDWNDGMDRVGEGGKGESVWLGWFLYAGLTALAPIAEKRGASEHAADWREAAAALKASLEREAWDGDWYRRAYFDDGHALGSVANSECRIDSIAQSWAVISRAADPTRAARAMEAVDKYLVRRDEKLAMLFAPPFDHPSHDPGYIKGYPPGIRENGGQYTHAAAWTAIAFAMQGNGDKAGELLAMLNPIHHAADPTGMRRYRVEPYVICADVYSVPPHVGRGGWTWYTGSAGWMYRAALEWLLGFRVQGANLALSPCIPHDWPGFEIAFRYKSSRYEISVDNPLGVCRGILAAKLDGKMLPADQRSLIPLVDDGQVHHLSVVLGSI
jgi:cyclic beta-1,2-glucan synthetase